MKTRRKCFLLSVQFSFWRCVWHGISLTKESIQLFVCAINLFQFTAPKQSISVNVILAMRQNEIINDFSSSRRHFFCTCEAFHLILIYSWIRLTTENLLSVLCHFFGNACGLYFVGVYTNKSSLCISLGIYICCCLSYTKRLLSHFFYQCKWNDKVVFYLVDVPHHIALMLHNVSLRTQNRISATIAVQKGFRFRISFSLLCNEIQ